MSNNKGISAADFAQWAAKRNLNLVSERGGFKAGDVVVYTNEFGVSFEGMTILGFDANAGDDERCVYTDSTSYWFPNKLSEFSFTTPVFVPEVLHIGNRVLTECGYDDWCQKLYKDQYGNQYVNVDGVPHTMTAERDTKGTGFLFSEPLSPLKF